MSKKDQKQIKKRKGKKRDHHLAAVVGADHLLRRIERGDGRGVIVNNDTAIGNGAGGI